MPNASASLVIHIDDREFPDFKQLMNSGAGYTEEPCSERNRNSD
jgi:hypothetical protein